MRLTPALAAQSLVVLGVLVGGCGSEESVARSGDAAPSTTPTASGSTEETECDKQCHADIRAERCRKFIADIGLRYDITAVPTSGGREIGLHMTLENRADGMVSGSTGGVLRVAPGPPSNRIAWGGSSADELYQRRGTTSRDQIWDDRHPPGWHPVGDHVTSFDFSTYLYAPGPGVTLCWVPATVHAPRGLVAGHPSGRWTQQSHDRPRDR